MISYNKPKNKKALIIGAVVLLVVSLGLIMVLTNFSFGLDSRSRASDGNKTAASKTLLTKSNVSDFMPGKWTFTVSDSNQNQSDWRGLNEDQVFWKSLVHSQDSNEKSLTIKLGKGGQIYSIFSPKTGEMIAFQRADHGQWVDEVYQHTIPSKLQKSNEDCSVVDGDIHQAGYYTKSDLDCTSPFEQVIPQSVYSPVFGPLQTEFINQPNTFSYITWPQHAHLPRTYSDNGMLMHQSIRDVGDGVFEITLQIDKWSGVETEAIAVPWAGFRTENIPKQVISLPNGSYEYADREFKASSNKVVRFNENSTGGWIAFVNSDPNQWGLGIVFGKKLLPISGKNSYLRWGTYSDGTIATVKHDVLLNPGDSVFFRYYLVFGSLRDIQKYGNMLESSVQGSRLSVDYSSFVGSIKVCSHPVVGLRRGCDDGQEPIFVANRKFSEGSVPLFLLFDKQNGQNILSTNPYTVSNDPTNLITKYTNILGWGLKKKLGPGSGLSASCYTQLTDLLSSAQNIKADVSLKGVLVRNKEGCY